MTRVLVWMLAGCLLALGCGKRESAREPAPPVTARQGTQPAGGPPTAAPSPADTPTKTPDPSVAASAPPTQQSAQSGTAKPQEAAPPPGGALADRSQQSTPVPEPDASPSPPAQASPPPAPASLPNVVDPGGTIEVAATKPGLTRIGVEKCKICHKLQFDSWAASAHARRTPPLDCEGCHGPGSEYKTLAIMKDPTQAAAAGLVRPTRSFCEQCHVRGSSDALLAAAHAHKPRP